MSATTLRTPSYRHHKPSGQAVVTLDGRDIYLGRYGTPQSRAELDRLLARVAVERPTTPGSGLRPRDGSLRERTVVGLPGVR